MNTPNMQNHDYYSYWIPVETGKASPDEWQSALMSIVAQAEAEGVFYNRDMEKYIKEHADFIPADFWTYQYQTGREVEGGKMGMEIHSARCALREKKIREDNAEALKNLVTGQSLGSMICNNKTVHKCVIESFEDNWVIIKASIGKYGCTIKTEARNIEGMKRRYQERKRK